MNRLVVRRRARGIAPLSSIGETVLNGGIDSIERARSWASNGTALIAAGMLHRIFIGFGIKRNLPQNFVERSRLLQCELNCELVGPAYFLHARQSCRFVHVKCERMTRWAENGDADEAAFVKCLINSSIYEMKAWQVHVSN